MRTFQISALLLAFFIGVYSPQVQANYVKGTWVSSVNLGIAPSFFSKQGKFTDTSALDGNQPPADEITNFDNNQVNQITQKFSFYKIYEIPFYLNMTFGRFVYDNLELFMDLSYMHGRSKNLFVRRVSEGNNLDQKFRIVAFWKAGALNRVSAAIGVRKYFKWKHSIYPFLGAKLGGVFLEGAKRGFYSSEFQGATSIMKFTRTATNSSLSFLGGVQVGFDWRASEKIALTLTSGLDVTAGKLFKSGRQLHPQSEFRRVTLFSNVSQNPQLIYSVPVTVGMRFTF